MTVCVCVCVCVFVQSVSQREQILKLILENESVSLYKQIYLN